MPPATLDVLFSYDSLSALAVTTVFAGGAWLLRGVTAGGALAGFALTFGIYEAAGPGGFVVVVTVFVVAWLSTRFGSRRKRALGMAQDSRGRSAVQVTANLGVAAVLAVAAAASQQSWLLLPAMAALAEAAADTAASECGEALSDRAYLITSMSRVRAGTDGGISVAGTLSGAVAVGMVATVAAAVHVLTWPALPIVAGAGFLGMVIDSLLGATLERRGLIGNSGVNLAGTTAAALIALLVAYPR